MNTELDAQVRTLALREAEIAKRIEVLNTMRQRFYDLYVAAYDAELDALNSELADRQASLKADFLSYVQETGDLDAHPSLTFVRNTKVEYDKAAALDWCKEHAAEFTRVKVELDVRTFEKAVRDNRLAYPGVEVINVPSVRLGKLGEYVIQAELEASS